MFGSTPAAARHDLPTAGPTVERHREGQECGSVALWTAHAGLDAGMFLSAQSDLTVNGFAHMVNG